MAVRDVAHKIFAVNTSLWRFSLSLYRQSGVEEECLSLQERFGVNINLLLLCLYAASEVGALLSRSDIAMADGVIAEWDTQVVKTLRKLRDLLKRSGMRSEWQETKDSELLRAQIKAAELESERIESAMLQAWFEGRLPHCSTGARQLAAATNWNSVLAYYGVGEGTALSGRLVDLALAADSRVDVRDGLIREER